MIRLTRQQFITKLAPYAIEDMKKSKVPASLTIAQGILESSDGNSTLTVEGNNLFGIKGTGTKGTIAMPTTEYVNGVPRTVMANFRTYHNWGESVADHSNLFLHGLKSESHNRYEAVIGKDGITAAKEVAKAKYATDPTYANKLIDIIETYNLLQYDNTEDDIVTDPTISNRLAELEKVVREVTDLLQSRLTEIPAPDWFTKEFPNALELITQKTGTPDFWRAFAITLRIIKKKGNA